MAWHRVYFPAGNTEAQRGKMICLRSHSKLVVELRLRPDRSLLLYGKMRQGMEDEAIEVERDGLPCDAKVFWRQWCSGNCSPMLKLVEHISQLRVQSSVTSHW